MFGMNRDNFFLLLGFLILWVLSAGVQTHGSAGAYFAYLALRSLTFFPVFLFSIVLHEYAHGWVAWRAGDHTARKAGRLTLNPLAHLSLMGTLAIFFFPIGWAKPVPVDPGKFKDRQIGEIAVSAAGPVVNLVLALIGLLCFRFYMGSYGPQDRLTLILLSSQAGQAANVFRFPHLIPGILLWNLGYLNLLLAVFNLIPVHPLDGSHILKELLPSSAREWYVKNQRMIGLVALFALFAGVLEPFFQFFMRWALRFAQG